MVIQNTKKHAKISNHRNMNQQNTEREEFISVINTLKGLSSTITDEQRKGLLQQAVQQHGFSVDEAKDILITSGLAVNEIINFFEVLELSIEKLQDQSDKQIKTLVDEVHKRLYSASLRAGGLPRPDGRTQEQWRNLLNQARDTLANPHKRIEHIAKIQNESLHYVDSILNVDLISPEQDEIPVDDPNSLSIPIPDDMVLIPAGEFLMGSKNENADDREKPIHNVYVDAFCIDKYPVTNRQYKEFIDANPNWQKPTKQYRRKKTRQIVYSILKKYHGRNYLADWIENDYPKEKANHPVTYVSWYAAMAYAEWIGKRLPTEAEWEKAARGGTVARRYPWGNRTDPANAEYSKDVGETYPVGKYPANNYGVHDMVGNVWEWCLDLYDADYYTNSTIRNPIAGVNSDEDLEILKSDFWNIRTDRVLRGGTHFTSSEPIHIAARWGGKPIQTSYLSSLYFSQYMANIGFRCAWDARFKS